MCWLWERLQKGGRSHFHSKAFANARAVLFVQEADSVRVTAIKAPNQDNDQAALLNHTMRDWLNPVNDDLFDFS